jgi:hypothetical protein
MNNEYSIDYSTTAADRDPTDRQMLPNAPPHLTSPFLPSMREESAFCVRVCVSVSTACYCLLLLCGDSLRRKSVPSCVNENGQE